MLASGRGRADRQPKSARKKMGDRVTFLLFNRGPKCVFLANKVNKAANVYPSELYRHGDNE